jgi:DNA-binding response OmpR family regulator
MSAEQKTVLVVDDDQDTLNVIQMKLESQQFKVVTTLDGAEALRLIRECKPDLIILDVMVPRLSGFKLARLVKFDMKSKGIPLILLTARTREVDRNLGLEVGANLYMTKPFDPETLLKEVQRLLGASP